MRRLCLVGLFALALVPLSASQRDAVPPPDQPIFRTSSTLATIDAVVTDDEGRPVTDLTKDDFEVRVSGKRQELQQAVFVRGDSPLTPPAPPAVLATSSSPSPTVPTRNASAILKASATGTGRITRTMAFVVDDLSLSFESTFAVRRALSNYIESEVEPGDLVAIVRTASGVGALQQFTTDKRLLRLAVDRVQWDFRSRNGVASFAPVTPTIIGGVGSTEKIDKLRQEMTGTGSLGAIGFVAQGIQYLPGRKSIVLLSEGFGEMFKERMEGGRLWNALTNMLDSANRAGVVLYTIDARGLQTAGLTAEDNPLIRDWSPGGASPDRDRHAALIREKQKDRNNELLNSQESLQFIADQTGGLAIMNTNDLGKAIDRVLADRGYYLLGYTVPPDTPLRGWNQGGVHISVKRPHTHVRSRQGFFGPASPRDAAKPMTDPLLLAALSPFANADISARLTSDFWHDGTKPSVQSMFFIDANDIAFSEADTGHRVAKMDLALFAVADNGMITATSRRSISMDLTADQYNDALKHGLVYRSRLFVDRPGAYQVRAAVRDLTTGRAGSSSQFLEIPKVGKGKLALSGVLLKGISASTATETDTLDVASASLSAETLLGPTIRILHPGAKAIYAYEIYDGLGDDGDLQMSATLIRNGKEVYRGPAEPVKARPADKKIRVISIGGSLDLGKDMPSGPYSLQVDVSRQRNGRVDRRASQWVDFEVRR